MILPQFTTLQVMVYFKATNDVMSRATLNNLHVMWNNLGSIRDAGKRYVTILKGVTYLTVLVRNTWLFIGRFLQIIIVKASKKSSFFKCGENFFH